MNSLSIKHLVNDSALKKTYIVQALGITFPTSYRNIKHPELFTARDEYLKRFAGKRHGCNQVPKIFTQELRNDLRKERG